MLDREIIGLFFERSEAALDELKKKYGRLYRQIIRRTLKNEADAEEAENDLLLAVWNSIPPQNPERLDAYLAVLSRRISAGKVRAALREKRSQNMTVLLSELEDCLPAENEIEQRSDSAEIRAAINEFLSELTKADRVVFVRRYFLLWEIGQLAQAYRKSENAISASLSRSRKKLLKHLKKRGIVL